VDFTLRIGWPQLEQSTAGAPSSPIRTTSAAVTRAADVVTAPVAGISTAATLFAQGTPLTPLSNASNQVLAGLSDGTNNNAWTAV
jgi:hypothetical protein